MQYFEVTLIVPKMTDSGTEKKVKETYLVDAMSFTEAEARSLKYEADFYNEIEVDAIKRTPYGEIINKGNGEKYYSVKIGIITLDEQSGKEKKSSVYYCVQGESVDDADNLIRKELGTTMLDYVVEKVAETKILDVIDA